MITNSHTLTIALFSLEQAIATSRYLATIDNLKCSLKTDKLRFFLSFLTRFLALGRLVHLGDKLRVFNHLLGEIDPIPETVASDKDFVPRILGLPKHISLVRQSR